jgi:hypothetical protein
MIWFLGILGKGGRRAGFSGLFPHGDDGRLRLHYGFGYVLVVYQDGIGTEEVAYRAV